MPTIVGPRQPGYRHRPVFERFAVCGCVCGCIAYDRGHPVTLPVIVSGTQYYRECEYGALTHTHDGASLGLFRKQRIPHRSCDDLLALCALRRLLRVRAVKLDRKRLLRTGEHGHGVVHGGVDEGVRRTDHARYGGGAGDRVLERYVRARDEGVNMLLQRMYISAYTCMCTT